jgi:hypothetical protein
MDRVGKELERKYMDNVNEEPVRVIVVARKAVIIECVTVPQS